MANIYSSCGIILAEATVTELDNFHGKSLPEGHKVFILNRLLMNKETAKGVDILPMDDPIEGWKYLNEVCIGSFFVWNSDLDYSLKIASSDNTGIGKIAFSDSSIQHINEWIKLNESKLVMTEEKYNNAMNILTNNINPTKNSKEARLKYRILANFIIIDGVLYKKENKEKRT